MKGSTKKMKKTSVNSQQKKEKTVLKLRPRKPLLSSSDDSILSVSQMLANKRGDASLIVNAKSELEGIITDTDITRRVVAKYILPESNDVSSVMTASPTCVNMNDSAMDALGIMVENHFRHLPVINNKGSVVGLLDIAKCLHDAIDKLERTGNKKNKNTSAENAARALAQSAGGAKAVALQALLGPLMDKAFGDKKFPSLRSLLVGKASSVVHPSTSLRQAGSIMAKNRSAALVVEDGQLVGIFGFKDMMKRAIAKELDLDNTEVSKVMTPNPEAVAPDTTALEALQTMHDHRFLTLPVCEKITGVVIGLVDVMDVIHGCGGAEGWRSIFSSVMDIEDDSTSIYSQSSAIPNMRSIGGGETLSIPRSAMNLHMEIRSVSKLRPKKPLLSNTGENVLYITQMLARKRGNASLVVNEAGGLAGIITDTDVTRRVVAKNLSPESTCISEVMTANPACVNMDDPAMDALGIMVENHFRHLPVVDATGAVVGLLDIAKCLHDAINKLERAKNKGDNAAKDVVALVKDSGGKNATALQALLGPLMAKAFGGEKSPPLRLLLAGRTPIIVNPTTSLRETGFLMAKQREAALVVEDGQLVGIFGFRDMMARAVSKELDLDNTEVSQVMSSNPEVVSPDTTVLEALQIMHEYKFLTLPVVESNGVVSGLVDVMDVINGCGGLEGWRSIFSSAMDMDDDSISASRSTKHDVRPVSKLRLKKPLLINKTETVFSCSKELAASRSSAAVIIDDSATLVGIITETDITRRVAAKHLDPATTELSQVMTPSPTCVTMTDSAMDALSTMIKNRYRHLPVVCERGAICGVLDISKCLNDAITKLELAEKRANTAASDAIIKVIGGNGGGQAAVLSAFLEPLMAQATGGKALPTLHRLLMGKPQSIVSPGDTVEFAAERMSDCRKAALIVEDDRLVGILTFKDVCTRVIAKGIPLASTPVSSVMTTDPEYMLPDQSVLEALQMMHDSHFLNLPVCGKGGIVVGLVDVMDVIYGCGGAEGWRSIFDSAIDIDESISSELQDSVAPLVTPLVDLINDQHFTSNSSVPRNIEVGTRNDSLVNSADYLEQRSVVFKVTDPSGNTHRFRCVPRRQNLFVTLLSKIGEDVSSFEIKFVDDEGDAVLITSDEDLMEATELAQKAGSPVVKLTISKAAENPLGDPIILGAIGAGCVTILLVLTLLLRPRRY